LEHSLGVERAAAIAPTGARQAMVLDAVNNSTTTTFESVPLPILEVARSRVEGELIWGRSTDLSHPWVTFRIAKNES
jgi:hypothetical protein